MSWDSAYHRDKKIWGEKPSELASFALEHLSKIPFKKCNILDIGCGYGRDAIYLSEKTGCSVLGIDCSAYAIRMANDSVPNQGNQTVKFLCSDFDAMQEKGSDIMFASNLYQVLHPADRLRFREFIQRKLEADGLFFMSTMAVGDHEHWGKGKPVSGEETSYEDEKYLHFCSREELIRDFGFLQIRELVEHEFFEPRSDGATHHHNSWLLFGIKRES